MDESSLPAFVLITCDIGIVVYLASIIYGMYRKKIYALGRWYCKEQNSGQYWQVIIGFILLAITVIFLRFSILGPRLLG